MPGAADHADTRNVTALDWERYSGRDDPAQRFRVYRLCECGVCEGEREVDGERCIECRGEGRVRELLATCATPEALGVAIVTLGREGEFEECPVGVLDLAGEVGEKWVVRPWLPSPRNVSDAGRVLGSARKSSGRKV